MLSLVGRHKPVAFLSLLLFSDNVVGQRGSRIFAGSKALDPLDNSNSLSDLAQSLMPHQPLQPSPLLSQHDESAPAEPAAHGPLVQLMHTITKPTDASQAAASATPGIQANLDDGEAVNHAAAVSLAQPPQLQEEGEAVGASVNCAETNLVQHVGDDVNVQQHSHDGLHSYGSGYVMNQSGMHEDLMSQQAKQDNVVGSSAQDFFRGQG